MYRYARSVKQFSYRLLHARLKQAMSTADAARILGVEPDASPEEIRRAYKRKALENHPDRGGDPVKMVEVNVAKEILDGNRQPDQGHSPSRYEDAGPAYQGTPWKEPEKIEVTWEQAKAKAGVPSGVEWFFITDSQWSKSNYSGDESSSHTSAWVVYGRTKDSHVFVGMINKSYTGYYVGHGGNSDVWDMNTLQAPIREGEKLSPAWLASMITRALDSVGFDGRFNSKVFDCRGSELAEKMKTQGGAKSLKHILVDLGEVDENDASVINRKQVIELKLAKDYDQKPGYYQNPTSTYIKDWYKLTLVVNGTEVDIKESDWEKFAKAKVGGKYLIDAIYGDYYYGGEKKNLTRLKAGKLILTWMAEKFTQVPDKVVASLKAAAAQMK